MPIKVTMEQPKSGIICPKTQPHVPGIRQHHSVLVWWILVRDIGNNCAMFYCARCWLLFPHSHVQNVKFMTMQVNWMWYLVINIRDNQFHFRIQIDFQPMNAATIDLKRVIKTMVASRRVFVTVN